MRKHACSTLLLSLALLAGCACPPVGGNSGGGRSGGGGDPSGGTFAFLGGLKCFFGGDDAKDENRPANDGTAGAATAGTVTATKTASDDTDHAAALTIR